MGGAETRETARARGKQRGTASERKRNRVGARQSALSDATCETSRRCGGAAARGRGRAESGRGASSAQLVAPGTRLGAAPAQSTQRACAVGTPDGRYLCSMGGRPTARRPACASWLGAYGEQPARLYAAWSGGGAGLAASSSPCL